MTSLSGIDPQLKDYIKKNQISEIYECLFCGLLVECPDDPLKWILENLDRIKETGLINVTWDMFISDEAKSKVRPLANAFLDQVFTFGTEDTVPSGEMFARAYNHYYNKLVVETFEAWKKFYLAKKLREQKVRERLEDARRYYKRHVMRVHLTKWKKWKAYVKQRQHDAHNIIVGIYNKSLSRLVFHAWKVVADDSRKTREYFERLERGELDEDTETEGNDSSDNYRDELSMLPRKCSVEIFRNLDLVDLGRCAQVSRSWRVITGAPTLWSNINFNRVKDKVTDKVVQQLTRKSRPYLLHLNLRQCQLSNLITFKTIAENKNLQDLNLSECCNVNDESLKSIIEGCPALLYLNISRTEISDGTLRSLAKNSSNLQFLSLAYCNKFTDKGLHYIANGKGCRKLIHFDVSGCEQITKNGYRHIGNGCRHLQSIFINDNNTLNDDGISFITEHCSQLRCVSLIGSSSIGDESFKRLARHKRITKLRVEGNSHITDSSFKIIGKQCSQLNHLFVVDCQRITDMTLKSLAPLRQLTVVNLADCVRISDSGVRQLVEGTAGTKIREMNLTNCVRVSDVSLLRVAQRCHNLTHLCLCYCEHVTDAGIELLANLGNIYHLDLTGTNIRDQGLASLGIYGQVRSLIVSECRGISDLGIQKFCQKVPDLTSLDVSHCMTLTDSAIKSLAFCCRMLTQLNVSGCPLLTDLSMQYLSGVCHYIHILNLSGCIYISDRALKYLRKGCRQLRHLNLLYCKSITKSVAIKMRSYCDDVIWSNDVVPHWFNYSMSTNTHHATGEEYHKITQQRIEEQSRHHNHVITVD